MTTDTPRTDAAIELYGDRPFMVSAVPVEFAEGLERELAASKAEVERLKEELELAVYGCGCDNYLQIYCDKHNPYNKTT